jgi:S1-C subfamily serine protease
MQRFRCRPKRIFLGVALAALCLASAGVARADSQVYQSMLGSTGLVEVPDPKGSVTYGTCWLVDRQRGLALTAQHIVSDAAEAVVYFPAYRNGTAITELTHYHRQVGAVHAWVVHHEAQRDLALLQLDALPDDVTAMPLAGHSAGPGEAVHSVGNSGAIRGTLWRYTGGRVRSVYQARILQEHGLLKARIVETQSPINPGDSGGPLVNDNGELVGVVSGTEKQTRLVSFNVDVSEVRAFLDEALGPKAQPAADARGTDRQSPPVQGSWKVTLIDREGEQLSGEGRFEADGTFTLTAQAEAGPQTRRGRYNYANGVLLMAWDRFEVREALYWVKDRRFTLLADEMLIFDRQPDAEPATESPLPKVLAMECSPQRIENANGPRARTGDQPLENGSGSHPAEQASTNWVIAGLLIGSTSVFLLVAIKVSSWHHKPAKRTTATTREVEENAPPGPSSGQGPNEGVSNAPDHRP